MTSPEAKKNWLKSFDNHLGCYQGTSLETYRDDKGTMDLINKMADELLPIREAFEKFTQS